MTTNGHMPPRQPGDRHTPEGMFCDDLDAIDETVAKITDGEVEEQLSRVLGQPGHARPIPEPTWQDFHAGRPFSMPGTCGTADGPVASQAAAEIVGAARLRARVLEMRPRHPSRPPARKLGRSSRTRAPRPTRPSSRRPQ